MRVGGLRHLEVLGGVIGINQFTVFTYFAAYALAETGLVRTRLADERKTGIETLVHH